MAHDWAKETLCVKCGVPLSGYALPCSDKQLSEVEKQALRLKRAGENCEEQVAKLKAINEELALLIATFQERVVKLVEVNKSWNESLLDGAETLDAAVVKYEGNRISVALLAVDNGSVTRAAHLLNISHQTLAYIISHRHPNTANKIQFSNAVIRNGATYTPP